MSISAKPLSDLQQTSLLFLRNIKQIGVFFDDGNGGMRRSKTFRVRDAPGHSVFLDATVVDGDENSTTVEQRYHVTRRTATELPTSDNRNLLSTLETNTAFSEAEVVLAFPLTVDSRPLLEKQEIFAFLPVRESRFKVRFLPYCAIATSRYIHVLTGRIVLDTIRL